MKLVVVGVTAIGLFLARCAYAEERYCGSCTCPIEYTCEQCYQIAGNENCTADASAGAPQSATDQEAMATVFAILIAGIAAVAILPFAIAAAPGPMLEWAVGDIGSAEEAAGEWSSFFDGVAAYESRGHVVREERADLRATLDRAKAAPTPRRRPPAPTGHAVRPSRVRCDLERPVSGMCASADPTRREGVPCDLRAVPVDGKEVVVDVANAYERMSRAAANEGIEIRVNSGFRSAAQQKALYDCYRGKRGNQCPPGCASCYAADPPDVSQHVRGRALDLIRSAPGALPWLEKHAREYGFAPLPGEPWHWNYTNPTAPNDRCAGGAAPPTPPAPVPIPAPAVPAETVLAHAYASEPPPPFVDLAREGETRSRLDGALRRAREAANERAEQSLDEWVDELARGETLHARLMRTVQVGRDLVRQNSETIRRAFDLAHCAASNLGSASSASDPGVCDDDTARAELAHGYTNIACERGGWCAEPEEP